MKNVIEQILDENNHEIICIQGNNHQQLKFEQIALLDIADQYYTILHPIAKDVGPDDVLVFRIDMFDEEAELVLEENEEVLNSCMEAYDHLYSKKK